MPPVAKAGGDSFRKDVQFATKDEAEQAATGIVMVPDKADLQQDFAREETIREFADQFGNFVEAGEGDGGIMHAAWPSEWMTLDRNEVLAEAEEIGGETAPAGAWIQEWSINDDELWSLIDDGVLEGYSIGAINVDWSGPYDPGEDDAVEDVEVADQLPDDALVWELTDGLIREVSAVDIPAVPDAEILDLKAVDGADKRLGDHLGDQDAFVDEAMERGHSEADAERLWDVLNRAIEVDGANDPGKESMLSRAGKAFLSVVAGGDDKASSQSTETSASDPAKEGRTLSTANEKSVMASIDAGIDVLRNAGVEDLPKRFTDRDDVDFDLAEHEGQADLGFEDGEEDEDEQTENDASGGDTPADNTSMSDDTDDDGEDNDKSLAEQNAEQINDLSDAVKDLTEAVNDDGDGGDGGDPEKTTEIEIDGKVYEVSKEEALSWFDEDQDADKDADAPATKEDVEELHERLDNLTRQSGGSHQLDDSGTEDKDSGLDALGGALA